METRLEPNLVIPARVKRDRKAVKIPEIILEGEWTRWMNTNSIQNHETGRDNLGREQRWEYAQYLKSGQ